MWAVCWYALGLQEGEFVALRPDEKFFPIVWLLGSRGWLPGAVADVEIAGNEGGDRGIVRCSRCCRPSPDQLIIMTRRLYAVVSTT